MNAMSEVDFVGDQMAATKMSRIHSPDLIQPLSATVYNQDRLNENVELRKPPMKPKMG